MTHLSLRVSLATLLTLAAALLLYWPGLSGPFMLDDLQNIVQVGLDNPDPEAVLYAFTHNSSGMLGRVVSMLSFIATGLLHGSSPWGYKFHNLLLHLVNALLLFRLLYLLLAHITEDRSRALLVAALVSMIWLFHPLLVSTVLYAVQRMTELAALFTLLALLAYLRMRRLAPSGGPAFLWTGWVLFPLCGVLALLSKESGALIPFYVAACELLVFGGNREVWRGLPRLRLWLGVFVALPLVLGAGLVLGWFELLTDYSSRNFTLSERLLTQVHALFFYIRLILLPRISEMSLFRDDFPVTSTLDPFTALLGLVLLALPALIWWLRRRQPLLAFGLAWFLVSHLLESTFIPLELVFEHRNYLAAVGLLLPPLYYLSALQPVRLVLGLALCLLLVLGLQTHSRVLEWSNEELFGVIAVADHPDSQRARVTHANYLYNRGFDEQAFEQLRAAAALDARDVGPNLHLVSLRCVAGELEAERLAQSEAELARYPLTVYGANALRNLLTVTAMGQCTVVDTASIGRLLDAALTMPNNLARPEMHGFLLQFRGMHAFIEGRYAEGVIAMREAYDKSGHAQMLSELALAQIRAGLPQDARQTLDYLREVNLAKRGIEDWLVSVVERALAEAEAGQAAGAEVVGEGDNGPVQR